MKTELMILAIVAMVASAFLNADSTKYTQKHLADTKLRIENAGAVYAKSQTVEKVAANKANQKPNKG